MAEGEIRNDVSLRDYLAAHAPADPQFWFEPKMPDEPAEAPEAWQWLEEHSVVGYALDQSTYLLNLEVIPAALLAEAKALNTEITSARAARDAWQVERNRQRCIQWPYAWANAVLATRDA